MKTNIEIRSGSSDMPTPKNLGLFFLVFFILLLLLLLPGHQPVDEVPCRRGGVERCVYNEALDSYVNIPMRRKMRRPGMRIHSCSVSDICCACGRPKWSSVAAAVGFSSSMAGSPRDRLSTVCSALTKELINKNVNFKWLHYKRTYGISHRPDIRYNNYPHMYQIALDHLSVTRI